MYLYHYKIIPLIAIDKTYLKIPFSLGFVIHVTIESKVQDYSYFSIFINNCFHIWCKSQNINDKTVSSTYLVAILVSVLNIY